MSDESLFREVDEEIRQEQFQKLWNRYGNLIMAVCLAVVVGVAGVKGWQYWQVKQSETAGEAFFEAAKLASASKTDDALKQFEAIGHPGYGQLARLRAAGAMAASGKLDEAVKAFDAIAADTSAAAPLRDLAKVRAAYALVDSAPPADVIARVKDLDVAGGTWRHAAREITMLAHWRAKDHAAADTAVRAILDDPETPQGIRRNAVTLGDLLIPLLGKK